MPAPLSGAGRIAALLGEIQKRARRLRRGRLSPKEVHALRVLIRRFDAAVSASPLRGARDIQKELDAVFKDLGRLRNDHVLREWVEDLSKKGLPKKPLLKKLRRKAARHRRSLRASLRRLDRASLKSLARSLRRLESRFSSGRLEAHRRRLWRDVEAAARSARGSRSIRALHRLRIALKKYRYFLETFAFLPPDGRARRLSLAQDALGNVHDLQLLLERIDRERQALGRKKTAKWHAAVLKTQKSFLRKGLAVTEGLRL